MARRITARAGGASIAGVRRCRGCLKEGDVIGEDRCPQLTLLRDAFMITWLSGDYSRRVSPGFDERRTPEWAMKRLERICAWANGMECPGHDLFDESLTAYRQAVERTHQSESH